MTIPEVHRRPLASKAMLRTRRIVMLALVSSAAAAGVVGSCSSFEDVGATSDGGAESASDVPTLAASDGSPDVARTPPPSCAPLGGTVGYFAHFAAQGAELAAIAVEPTGELWLSGGADDLDLGTGAPTNGAFLVKLDGAGKARELEVVAAMPYARGRDIVLNGRAFWSVYYQNAIAYRDAGYFAASDGGYSSVVFVYRPSTVQAEPFRGTNAVAWQLAPVAGDGVFVGGHFPVEMAAMGKKLDAGPSGGVQMFAARTFSSAGGSDGIVTSVGPGDRIVRGAATDGQGRLHLTGRFTGVAPFVDDAGIAQESDAFLATFLPDLTFERLIAFGGLGAQEGLAVAGLSDGDAVVTGHFTGQILGPTGALGQSFGKLDTFITRIGAKGSVQWNATLGGPEDDAPVAIADDPVANRLLLLGRTASAQLKVGELTAQNRNPGTPNTFVAAFTPSGVATAVWLPRGGNEPSALAVDARGRVYIAGTFTGALTLDSITKTAAGKSDVFVIRCDP